VGLAFNNNLFTGSRLMNALKTHLSHLQSSYKRPTWLPIHRLSDNLISVQSTCRRITRSSSVLILARPSVSSSLVITNHQPLFQICITSPVEPAQYAGMTFCVVFNTN